MVNVSLMYYNFCYGSLTKFDLEVPIGKPTWTLCPQERSSKRVSTKGIRGPDSDLGLG